MTAANDQPLPSQDVPLVRLQARRAADEPASNLSAQALGLEEAWSNLDKLERQARRRALRLVHRGQLLPEIEFAHRAGCAMRTLRSRVRTGEIFFLEFGFGRLYPTFFLERAELQRQFVRVSKALGEMPGDEKWHFFSTRRVVLGRRTPLALVRRGQVRAVLLAAQAFARA